MLKNLLFYMKNTCLVCLALLFWWVAFAFNVPDYDGYVTDKAKVLTIDQEEKLESLIYTIWKETDVEIAVLFVNTLSGEDIWSAGFAVAEERGVGDADKDNGLVMLFAIEDRKWNVQVWYGLEWLITDSIAKRIGENIFPLYFREGKYASWVFVGIERIHEYLLKDPEVMQQYEDSVYEYSSWFDTSLWFVILGLVYLFSGYFLENKYVVEKKSKNNTKYKMKKNWRMNFWVIGLIKTALLVLLTNNFIASGIVSYWVLLFMLATFFGDSSWSSSSWWSSSSSSSWSSSSSSSSSSFGWFSGGSFGWGGASWSW